MAASTPEPTSQITRLLLEAEDFTPQGPGWSPIGVGQGNYMVDSIGASHVSGEALLHAPADAEGALASLDSVVPRTARYKLWARYEYPFRDYHVRFALAVEQPGREPLRLEYGRPDATRLWFFNLPDGPWNDLPNGVEGLVAEAQLVDLEAGPASFSLEVVGGPELAANRNLDFLLLTTDLDDSFRGRGARAYPILDEAGAAAAGRAYLRITNPADSGESFHLEGHYTINRVPWTLPSFLIDRTGLVRQGARVQRLEPGARTSWIDISCRDTTHPGHLQLVQNNNSQNRRVTLQVEIGSAPSDDAVLRRIEYREESASRLLLNIPPYPARAPQEILTAEETLERMIRALEEAPPAVGKPPFRTLVYAGLGDDAEKNLSNPARIYRLYRRLFFLLGPNAFNRLGTGGLASALQAMREEGRAPPTRWLTLGDFRWYPTDDNIAKARRDVDAARAQPYLRGFSYGDEVGLQHWAPKDERDSGLRAYLQTSGLSPEDVLAEEAAQEVAGRPPSERWERVHFMDSPRDAQTAPRLYVESQRYLARTALDGLAGQAARLRATFGEDILYGGTYSPHPYFWPSQDLFVQAFRRGAANRATHDDYWWQASELGPQMTGYLLDVFRCGLRGRAGVIQPYVMPHSPGNTDAEFRRGVYTALAHGAKALDFFQVGPEHAGTENYIRHDDLARYRTVRDVTYEIGAVDDLLADGAIRAASVAIILSESTDLWERATPGVASGLNPKAGFPSIAYNAERKFVWLALRHTQVPIDFITEEDLAAGGAGAYRVLYLVGDHLATNAAVGLASWVAAGGTLISTAGGGILDEYDRPLATLQPVFGLRSQQLEKRETFIRPRIELPRLEPLDTLTADLDGQPVEVPALAFRQELEPSAGTDVLARYSDGTAAATSHRYGSGLAILWGSLIGAAYVQSGFPSELPPPDRGPFTHTPLVDFSPERRTLIALPTQGLPRNWAECSDHLVETGLLETERALLIPLASLAETPRTVQLTVHAVGRANGVRSVRRGPLAFVPQNDVVRCTLDLDVTDFVVIERQPNA